MPNKIKKYIRTNSKYSNAAGFTLSEVLITLAVIGIISAITIPILLNNSREAQAKTAWKKAFAVASQSLMRSGGDYGSFYTYLDRWNSLKANINVVKECDGDTFGNCLPANGINPDSSLAVGNSGMYNSNQNNTKAFVTADGMIWFKEVGDGGTNPYFCIAVDINGQKAPNQWGKDVFTASINGYGKLGIDAGCDITGNSESYLLE